MFDYQVDCAMEPFAAIGARGIELMRFFGMSRQTLRRSTRRYRLSLTLWPGWICCIVGPSGSGKSVLLNALYDRTPPTQRIRLDAIALDDRRTVIDCIDKPPLSALPLLGRVGLSDAPALLLPPMALSDGQQWRYRLAMALLSDAPLVFADEFCASLDATTALVISYHLRRLAQQTQRCFVLAGCRDDVLGELMPDVIVRVGAKAVQAVYRNPAQHTQTTTA
jgi:hypothetical protein